MSQKNPVISLDLHVKKNTNYFILNTEDSSPQEIVKNYKTGINC